MTKYSEAQKNSIIKYARENLKRVPLDVPKQEYENRISPAAKNAGLSVSKFIRAAINEKIERDNLLSSDHE